MIQDWIIHYDQLKLAEAKRVLASQTNYKDFERNPVSSHPYYHAMCVVYGFEKAIDNLGEMRSNFEEKVNNG